MPMFIDEEGRGYWKNEKEQKVEVKAFDIKKEVEEIKPGKKVVKKQVKKDPLKR